jgi:hypothetical protein
LINAGHAASASSARQPGSFAQLTASKCAVGADVTAGLRVLEQAVRSTTSAHVTIRFDDVCIFEVRPLLLGNEECPHFIL